MEEEYSNEKLTKTQIIALIIMGLILICVFILHPDPYAEKDRYDQQQDQIRLQISNERRMQIYREEAARNGAEDQSDQLEKFIAY